MEILRIKGGRPLEGQLKAAGAKNAVTKILVASLISDKRCILHNVPNIAEVEVTVDLCVKRLALMSFGTRQQGTTEITTRELKTAYIPQRFSGANRIPILMNRRTTRTYRSRNTCPDNWSMRYWKKTCRLPHTVARKARCQNHVLAQNERRVCLLC
jgi:UDP-N-acetylglucosamine enolpyruvyl transferase